MNTQGECPGLGAPAPSGREGELLPMVGTIFVSTNISQHEEGTRTYLECLAKNMPASGKAILFGSQARGTARDNSDWDILIILDKEKLMAADYDNITYPLTKLGWELGEEINPVMYTTKEWEKYRKSLFAHIFQI